MSAPILVTAQDVLRWARAVDRHVDTEADFVHAAKIASALRQADDARRLRHSDEAWREVLAASERR